MTRADQRQVLEAFSRDFTRELHNLLSTDLGRFPAFVFQQLYNRLQWHVTEGKVAERITNEAARRAAPGRPSWLHLRTRQRESEALIRTLAGYDGAVGACAFSPDGRRLVSASQDKTLKLWDASAGAEIYAFPVLGALPACAFSPLGDRVCCGDKGGSVYILELMGALIHSLPGTPPAMESQSRFNTETTTSRPPAASPGEPPRRGLFGRLLHRDD